MTPVQAWKRYEAVVLFPAGEQRTIAVEAPNVDSARLKVLVALEAEEVCPKCGAPWSWNGRDEVHRVCFACRHGE